MPFYPRSNPLPPQSAGIGPGPRMRFQHRPTARGFFQASLVCRPARCGAQTRTTSATTSSAAKIPPVQQRRPARPCERDSAAHTDPARNSLRSASPRRFFKMYPTPSSTNLRGGICRCRFLARYHRAQRDAMIRRSPCSEFHSSWEEAHRTASNRSAGSLQRNVPRNRPGFCSQNHERDRPRRHPSTVTRAFHYSSMADWVFGVARLISSRADSQNRPFENDSRSSHRRSRPLYKRSQEIARDWIREKRSSSERRERIVHVVFPTPGNPSSQMARHDA